MNSPAASTSREALESLRTRLKDRYVIERELGRGGMGAVYLGRDIKLERHVALKVLPQEFAVQPMLRDRFLRETRTAAGFSHPNIVPVYAIEDAEDLLAYAMGYVEGESLQERVRRAGPLTVREIVKLMQDVAYALAYAHGRDIVHRDIKPDNIMIDRATGRALVMDFGIARAKSSAPVAATAGLTRVGEVIGTPEYMSPEQASGDEVDGRSDLYSLGLTMMFAATGKIAVTAESTQKVLVKQLTEMLPSMSTLRADLPAVLSAAIDRCVMKTPSERFETAGQLVDALDNSQLIAAEIPLPIRLFSQDANALTFIILSFVLLSMFIVQSVSRRGRGDEELLLVVVLFSIVITRALQTMREARRLMVLGFSTKEIVEGLSRVVDEQAGRRQELRADPEFLRVRRRAVFSAIGLLAAAFFSFRYVITHRVLLESGEYAIVGWSSILIVLASVFFGAGLVLLFKSPVRMPLSERMFRWLWLGPMGRTFVAFAGRGVSRTEGTSTRSTGGVMYTGSSTSGIQLPKNESRRTTNAGTATPPTLVDTESRLDAIERRLDTLERR